MLSIKSIPDEPERLSKLLKFNKTRFKRILWYLYKIILMIFKSLIDTN